VLRYSVMSRRMILHTWSAVRAAAWVGPVSAATQVVEHTRTSNALTLGISIGDDLVERQMVE
jgi:hypothetical protein